MTSTPSAIAHLLEKPPQTQAGGAASSASSPSPSLLLLRIDLRQGVDARTLAGALSLNGTPPTGPHDAAALTARLCVPAESGHRYGLAELVVEAHLRQGLVAERRFSNVRCESRLVDGAQHVDLEVVGPEPVRLLALSIDPAGRIIYAASHLPSLFGVPGGRYDPPEVLVQVEEDRS